MERLRYAILIATSGLKHWATRRFTPAGRLVLCALAASAVWGMDTTQSMAYQSFTFFSSLILLSFLSARAFHSRFRVRRTLPRLGTAGQTLAYAVAVENLGAKPERGLSLIEELPDPRPSLREFSAEKRAGDAALFWLDRALGFTRWRRTIERKRTALAPETALADIPARGRLEISATITPTRRGRLTLSCANLARPDPLGLFKAFAREPAVQSALILPKRYPVPRLTLPGVRRYQRGGVAMSSSVGDSQEFLGLRDYRPGDALRRIHWPSWAKTGHPVVKEYEDEYFLRYALVLDTFAKSGQEEAFEEAVSVASSFACSALTQESLLDLLFVADRSYCFTAGRGLGGTDRMLEILAGAQICADKKPAELFAGVLRRRETLSGALCVLLDWDEPRREFITRLKALDVPVLAVVVAQPGTIKEENAHARVLEMGRIAEGLAKL